MNYLSLFSGIGGFERGIELSDKNKELNCVGYAEVDKYARKIYKRHYPNHTPFGDVKTIDTKDLPDFEFLVAGFPCQAFSYAGKRGGFNDARGTLFFEVARILKDKKPRYFLLENVTGLLSHDKGRTISIILRTLANLGYDVLWEVHNSREHGVPQNRARVFFKGFLRTRCAGEVLSNFKTVGTTSTNDKRAVDWIYTRNRQCKIINKNRNGLTLTGEGQNSGTNQLILEKAEKSIKLRNNTSKGYINCYEGDGVVLTHPNCRGRVQTQQSPPITCSGTVGTLTKSNGETLRLRRLTPIECERLQGFPDNWTKYGANHELISDYQRYKTLGNAVTTNVIRDILNDWNMIL